MGKSPGKWIKTVLFGKKSSKSNISKAREKLVKQKDAPIASKASETEFSFDPTPITFARNERDPKLENKDPENLLLQNQADIAGSDNQDAPPKPERIMQEESAAKLQATSPPDVEKINQEEAAAKLQATSPPDVEKINQEEAAMKVQATLTADLDKIKQEEAAMKVQAAFRGYLARRAFKTIKGIIRLQALIRGHLVRRQAISTLCCMYGITKLQALVRGRRVRQSDVGYEMHGKCNLVKPLVNKCDNSVGLTAKIANMSANVFIHKLLASSTATTALHFQYASGNPNEGLSWLERWSASHFWKPVPKPKKLTDSKSQRKLGDISNGDAQMSKPKRGNWKIPSSSSELVLVQENSAFEKPKRNLRKISSKPTDHQVQENLENEFEKVKRNLRKVHNPAAENSDQPEVESESVKQHSEKAAVTSGYGVSEEEVKSSSNEKIKMDATLAISNEPDEEVTLRISVRKEAKEASNMSAIQVPLRENTSRCKKNSGEEATKELKDSRESCNNDENSPLTNGHLSLMEDSTGNENQKPVRKSPVVAKEEIVEDGLQNSPTPTLPSYMAATESAKAKLRAQGSPRFGQDGGGERSNLTRRHSLPSSNNSKISSHSPRTQRPAQAGGKGGHKSDRKMGSSKSGNGKLTQAEWRR